MTPQRFVIRSPQYTLLLVVALALGACVAQPTRTTTVVRQPVPPPDTNVYFYPLVGRNISAEQQDRDRFECNSWAVQKTGFDPSLPNVPAQQRVRVVAGGSPPGTGTAVGAATGAVLGGALASPWHTGPGLFLGAITGAAIGTIAEAQSNDQANRAQAQADAHAQRAQRATLDRNASNYRRAMSACLEGRGYSVR